jgi:hypothetical protein
MFTSVNLAKFITRVDFDASQKYREAQQYQSIQQTTLISDFINNIEI